MLIMGIVNLTFDIVTVYTVNHLEAVSYTHLDVYKRQI